MQNKSRRIALCGMMCALAMVVMMLGGMIPLATFCCPALAGILLLPVYVEAGERLSLGAYVAIAALGMILSPDKESALLFAFLGYYPVIKWRLDKISRKPLQIAAKLALCNVAAAAMLLVATFVLNMQSILEEYAEMTQFVMISFILLANITMLIYDRLLGILMVLYLKKYRRQWIR